uniref:Uncharacterized protein n=1 Tax=Erpetoichthys calabaricus TaxID=27687 RepID=A0A8C4SJX0_ERPCA
MEHPATRPGVKSGSVLSCKIVLNSTVFSIFSWITEEWEHCTRTCGSSGYQLRSVRCVQPLHDGTNRSVHTKYCIGDKPESRRPCNRSPCPAQWKTSSWSEVSMDKFVM